MIAGGSEARKNPGEFQVVGSKTGIMVMPLQEGQDRQRNFCCKMNMCDLLFKIIKNFRMGTAEH